MCARTLISFVYVLESRGSRVMVFVLVRVPLLRRAQRDPHRWIRPNRKAQQKKCLQHNTTHQREANVIGANSVIRGVVIHFQYLVIILPPTQNAVITQTNSP